MPERSEAEKAEEKSKAVDEAKEKIRQIEEDPPEKLEDWPEDEAKYETFGGPEGGHSYDEGPDPEDGSVSIEGEEVDDPEKYKGEPIPGGPTDPDAPDLAGERKNEDESGDG